MASGSPASVTSPQEAGPTNIIKMFTTYTNILAEATVREYYEVLLSLDQSTHSLYSLNSFDSRGL